jgi:predicted XRE-type DNA-binding protein
VLAGDIRFFPDKISQKRGKVGFSSKETMLDAQNMLPEAKLIDDVQKHIETTGLKQKSLWSNALKDTFP